MEQNTIFCSPGKLDLMSHTISEGSIPAYLAGTIEEEGVELTEEIAVIMVGKELSGKIMTLLFFMDGVVKKTRIPPYFLHKAFELKRGVQNQANLREALNFHFKKRPKFAALVTPATTLSRLNPFVWVNLNKAVKYRRGHKQKDAIKRSLIDFSFGATVEVHIGIQSVRNTFLVDVIEAWTIQKNHLLGAQPLINVAGVTNPENAYMKQKIANKNAKIDKKNKQIRLKKDQLKRIGTMKICPVEFIDLLHIIAKFMPLKKNGFFLEADIDDFPRHHRKLVKNYLQWKEGDYHDSASKKIRADLQN